MSIFKSVNTSGSLKQAIAYVDKDNANGILSRGINCSSHSNIALKQMNDVKNLFGKNDGRMYKHYVLSFQPRLPNKSNANKPEFDRLDTRQVQAALDYAERLIRFHVKNKYQAYLAAHVNSDGVESYGCLHVHIVINSVSLVDGKKYQSSPKDLRDIKAMNDKMASELGFSIVSGHTEKSRVKRYSKNEYEVAKSGKAFYKDMAFRILDKLAFSQQNSFSEARIWLNERGWDLEISEQKQLQIVCRNEKYKNGRYIKFNVNALAKTYNRVDLKAVNIMRNLNYADWQSFNHSNRSFKRQCADAILDTMLSKPDNFKIFQDRMKAKGWLVDDSNGAIKFRFAGFDRSGGRSIKFYANRIADDFKNVSLSSMIIKQLCNDANYQKYEPQVRTRKKFKIEVLEQSKIIAEARGLELKQTVVDSKSNATENYFQSAGKKQSKVSNTKKGYERGD